ncbi:Hypersensitive-induced response protein 1 (OsHIR1) [Durusdinium trenchii]|uniref:Hypersensitive-induced response protein 1 (OsHIR1) n=1 Tax=Durusdinium trenchii TaxID=1381693 RepID=A0ABP0QFU7_9DINO
MVPNDRVGVVERFGKFARLVSPGIAPVLCCLGETVAGSLSKRVQQIDVVCETKTKDNVFVHVAVSVQFEARPEQYYEAFYRLSNVQEQIKSYVYDVIRSAIPKIILDEVFDSKDEVAMAVKNELSETMPSFGWNILQALVVDITPDSKVKNAMNEINAAQRIRQAAGDKAEAEKILVVKAAEADAESKFLQGVGISRQRQAIVEGLRESVVQFTDNVSDISSADVMQLMLMTQYLDTMKDIGASSKATTVFIPSNPGEGLEQVRGRRHGGGQAPPEEASRLRQYLDMVLPGSKE